jgi:hypothetical protein
VLVQGKGGVRHPPRLHPHRPFFSPRSPPVALSSPTADGAREFIASQQPSEMAAVAEVLPLPVGRASSSPRARLLEEAGKLYANRSITARASSWTRPRCVYLPMSHRSAVANLHPFRAQGARAGGSGAGGGGGWRPQGRDGVFW